MGNTLEVETSTAATRWARLVERYESSGLSRREFTAREGLKAGSLSSWKSRLRQRVGRSAKEARVTPFKFVELTASAPAAPPPPAAVAFEIGLRSGRTVRVAGGFHAAELVRLLNVLEEGRS